MQLITHVDNSRMSKAFSGVYMCCVSVCLHDKTKTDETTITNLATEIVCHESTPIIL